MLSTALRRARGIGRRIQRFLPASMANGLKQLYHERLLPMTYDERVDADILREFEIAAAPPPALRHRVHGDSDLRSFLSVGHDAYLSIQEGLKTSHAILSADSNVLDFGCGSGRTLLWWAKSSPRPQLFGTDIDAEAVAWISAHLPITVNVNDFDPPLPYADGAMDVIYSISVLTHLPEEAQDRWLAELRRIVRPGGILLISVHSSEANELLSTADRTALQEQGILFTRGFNLAPKIFGETYQNTYHSDNYIAKHWGAMFEIVNRIGMGRQDLLVMRKRSE
jgi:SAM-dependent methyltransferase